MKSLLKPPLALICTLILVGCASSSHVLVGNARPPISPDQVKVYLKPPAKFEEIALLDASSRSSWTFTDQAKMNKAVERLKKEAAKLGANGVLLRGAGDQYGGSVSTGSGIVTGHGNITTGFGIGSSSPEMDKAASGVAIFVLEE